MSYFMSLIIIIIILFRPEMPRVYLTSYNNYSSFLHAYRYSTSLENLVLIYCAAGRSVQETVLCCERLSDL